MQRKKILYVITKSNFGGAQRYVFDLATNLPEDQFEVVVAFGGTGRRGEKPGLLDERLNEAGIRTIFIKNFQRDISSFREIRALFELRKIIREEAFDILHLNSSKAGGIGALAGRLERVPNIIYTAHGWAFWEQRSLIWRTLAWLASWVTALLVDTVIVVSKSESRNTHMPFVQSKLRTIYNGVSSQTYIERERARIHLAPHVPLNTPLIGSVSELNKNKNIQKALEACALLVRKHIAFHYVVIGSGEERESLEQYAQKLNLQKHVSFLGFSPDAPQLLRGLDIFLLPSQKEGLPYVLLEAGYAQLPAVASEVGGIPEIVIDTKTGLLIDPGNPEDIAKKLSVLLTDTTLRTTLGTALHQRVQAHFSLDQMLRETSALY